MASKFDTCIYAEYFGDYSQRLCNHPLRGDNHCIEVDTCRKCKCYQTEKTALKDCPFCGKKARLSQYLGDWYATCTNCGAEILRKTVDNAMVSWNRRPSAMKGT